MPHSVLIAEDDALVRDGLQLLIDLEEDFTVVAVAANGADAVAGWIAHTPDITLMDVRMPQMDGVEATRRIRAESGSARVVVLTTFRDDDAVRRALAAGAVGYLLKSQPAETIIKAMRAVCAGATVFDPDVVGALLGDGTPAGTPAGPPPNARTGDADDDLAESISDRERSVLALIAKGKSNREIAAALCIGEGTVRNYVSELLFKLHRRDRTQLAIYYHTRIRDS